MEYLYNCQRDLDPSKYSFLIFDICSDEYIFFYFNTCKLLDYRLDKTELI